MTKMEQLIRATRASPARVTIVSHCSYLGLHQSVREERGCSSSWTNTSRVCWFFQVPKTTNGVGQYSNRRFLFHQVYEASESGKK